MKHNSETLVMIIKFYNMQAGTACRSNNEQNQRVVDEALTRANDEVATLKNHIRTWVKENPEASKINNCLTNCMEAYVSDTTVPAPTVVPQSTTNLEQQATAGLGILENVVTELLARTKVDEIEKSIMDSVETRVRDFIKSEYGTIERKVTTVIDGKKVPMQGIQHEKFETVLKFVANDEPVFLTGPAGSGKNVICKQVAEALGLKFYFTNAVTQEYKLTGFTDANGTFHETQFYKAFTQGGVFMLDEMDASIPEVLVILNAAIANRYFDFPAPIGYVEAHPDFRVIAAGNTTGHGADYEYVGRNQLDGASLDRFAIVRIDYSPAIENSVAGNDIELADFCRDFRHSADKAGISIIISYRAIGRLAKMLQLLSIDEALETCLIKGLEKDDINMIYQGLTKHNQYRDAIKRMVA